jgi:hypothetical protein
MQLLTPAAFERARRYVATHARPLDRALFAFYFEDGTQDAVLEALAAFQNHDGGFGRALEPDIRSQASSVIATSTAFGIMRDVGTPAGHPLVLTGLRYLLLRYQVEQGVWPIVSAAIEDAPHAPWWDSSQAEVTFGRFQINPRAAVLGHLYHYLMPHNAQTFGVAAQLALKEATQKLREHVAQVETTLGKHDLDCLLTLVTAHNVPASVRLALLPRIEQHAAQGVVTDPAEWGNYAMLPLDLVKTPDALLAPVISADALQANLDYVIERQLPDGSWPLSWQWSFVDADAWAQAEKDWKGHLAVQTLQTLRAFGRIEA